MKPSHILAAAAPLASLAHARQARRDEPVSIYTDTTRQYDYYGCYNETTQVEGGANTRALSGGSSLVKPGEMTVPMCLEFCAKADDEGRKYRYAGVEWSRECWCSQNIAGIAVKLDDNQCNYACEGNKSMACGGSLKLNVYRASAGVHGAAVSGAAAALALAGLAMSWL